MTSLNSRVTRRLCVRKREQNGKKRRTARTYTSDTVVLESNNSQLRQLSEHTRDGLETIVAEKQHTQPATCVNEYVTRSCEGSCDFGVVLANEKCRTSSTERSSGEANSVDCWRGRVLLRLCSRPRTLPTREQRIRADSSESRSKVEVCSRHSALLSA